MTDNEFLREVGRRVRQHRHYRELTQQQLADSAGLSRSFVSLLETGGHGIQVLSLRRVAASLDLRFSALVDDPADAGTPLLLATRTTFHTARQLPQPDRLTTSGGAGPEPGSAPPVPSRSRIDLRPPVRRPLLWML